MQLWRLVNPKSVELMSTIGPGRQIPAEPGAGIAVSKAEKQENSLLVGVGNMSFFYFIQAFNWLNEDHLHYEGQFALFGLPI